MTDDEDFYELTECWNCGNDEFATDAVSPIGLPRCMECNEPQPHCPICHERLNESELTHDFEEQ